MPATDPGRPQDQGRRHRRRGAPPAATATLLDRWHETLRAELEAVIAALQGPDPQLTIDGSTPPAIPLEDPRRDRLISRGVTVGRELGSEVDATPAAPADQGRRRRPAAVKFE